MEDVNYLMTQSTSISSVQCLSHVWLFATMDYSTPGFPCPSPTPRACSNSCPSCQWCHPTVSSSVIPFSSCLQTFLESGSFLMSLPFTSDGQSIGASASASVLPMNVQDWFPLEIDWLDLLAVQGTLRVFSNITVQEYIRTDICWILGELKAF